MTPRIEPVEPPYSPDALHEGADIGDELWARLTRELGPEELLDLVCWRAGITRSASPPTPPGSRPRRGRRASPTSLLSAARGRSGSAAQFAAGAMSSLVKILRMC